MKTWYKSIAIFLSAFMFFMHPLALIASEVAISTSAIMTSQIPTNFLFTQDMYNGITNNEVKMLQIFLNGDSRTVVNRTGPGSTGNETTYFGNATQNAVERFQLIYKSVILDPIGFTSPTGIVGARSRSVLNKILDNLRNGRPTDTNVFVGAVVANTATSTAGTVSNNLLFQTAQVGTTTINNSTSTNATTSVALQIPTNTIPQATVGNDYIAIIQGLGGNSSYDWSILYGSLPNGITARTSTCIASPCKTPLLLSGKPTSAGSYTFIVRLVSGNTYVTKELVINIQDRPGTITQNSTTTSTPTFNPATYAQTATTTNTITPPSSSSASSGSNIGLAVGILGGAAAVSAISSASSDSGGSSGGGGGGPRTVFGGKITYVFYCTCMASYLLYIYDFDLKSVIQLMFIPGVSTLHQKYNVYAPGPTVLGGYTQGSIGCYYYAGTSCSSWGSPTGVIDTLRGVGTTAS